MHSFLSAQCVVALILELITESKSLHRCHSRYPEDEIYPTALCTIQANNAASGNVANHDMAMVRSIGQWRV